MNGRYWLVFSQLSFSLILLSSPDNILPAWPLYDFASFTGLSRYCHETIGAGFRRGRVGHRRASGLTNMSLCCRAGWYLHEKSNIRMCKQPGGDAAEIDADLESSQRLLSRLISCVRERAGEININTRKYTLYIFPFNLLSYLYFLSSRPPKLSRQSYLSHFFLFCVLFISQQPSPDFFHVFASFSISQPSSIL